MKETKRKFYKKICKWKKQILCVGAGIFLGIAAWLAQGMDPLPVSYTHRDVYKRQ